MYLYTTKMFPIIKRKIQDYQKLVFSLRLHT
jgi:hypothetical protein